MKRVLYTMLCLSTCICNVYSEDTHSSKNVRSSDGRISIGGYVEFGQFGGVFKYDEYNEAVCVETNKTKKKHAFGGSGGLCIGYVYYTGKMRMYGEVRCGMGMNGRVKNIELSDDGKDEEGSVKRGVNFGCSIGCSYIPNNSNWYVGGACYIGYEICKYQYIDTQDRKERKRWRTKGVIHLMPCLEIGYDNRNVNFGLYFGYNINVGNKVKNENGEKWFRINHGFCGGIKLSVLI